MVANSFVPVVLEASEGGYGSATVGQQCPEGKGPKCSLLLWQWQKVQALPRWDLRCDFTSEAYAVGQGDESIGLHRSSS